MNVAGRLVVLVLLGATAVWADGPPPPTEEERRQIRELAGKVMGGRHPSIRSAAASSLGAMGPKAEQAVPALVSALKDRDSTVSSTAAVALGKVGVGSKEAVTGLVGALSNARDPLVKAAAAEGLRRVGSNAASATPQLVAALESPDADVRREAALALGSVAPGTKHKATLPRLAARLEDDDARVRLCAAIALTRLEDRRPELVEALAAGVPKKSGTAVEMRHAACEALGQHGPGAAGAVPDLIGVLGERHDVMPGMPYVAERQAAHDALRCAAATALGKIGDRAAVEPLERAAEVSALEQAAREALAALGE